MKKLLLLLFMFLSVGVYAQKEKIYIDLEIKDYPNMTRKLINVKFDGVLHQNAVIRIVSDKKKEVWKNEKIKRSDNYVDVSHFKTGTYFVMAINGKASEVRRVIINGHGEDSMMMMYSTFIWKE